MAATLRNAQVIGCDETGAKLSTDTLGTRLACASSAIRVLVAVRMTPAAPICCLAKSSDSSVSDPEASITACTSYPSSTALMA